MPPKNIKIKSEEKAAAGDYLAKAKDNYTQMLSALKSENFNAAGTLAIQCAISSADAICVYEKGARSISSDHFDVCRLLDSLPIPEAKERANLLKRIIAKKNLIQYERRNMHQPEAEEIAKNTARFYQWVNQYIIP